MIELTSFLASAASSYAAMLLHPRPHALDNHNINISFLTIFHHTETSDEKLTDIVMPLADVFFADTAAGEASQPVRRQV